MIKVAIIDDEIWIVKLLLNIIDWEAKGFTVIGTYNDAFVALEEIKKSRPQLVITDIRMPGKTGLEVVEEIRADENCRDIQFIIISGYNDFGYAKQAIALGVMGYLLKPVDEQDLETVIDKAKACIIRRSLEKQCEMQLIGEYNNAIGKARELYFNNVFEGNSLIDDNIAHINAQLNLNFVEAEFKVVLLSARFFWEAGVDGSDIYKAIWECGVSALCYEMIMYNKDFNFVLVLNFRRGGFGDIHKCLLLMFEKLLQKKYSKGVTMAIGSTESSLFHLPRSYETAKQYLMLRLALGDNKIFDENVIADIGAGGGRMVDSGLEMALIEALREGSREKCCETIMKAIEGLVKVANEFPLDMIRGLFSLLGIIQENCRYDMNIRGMTIDEFFDGKRRKLEQSSSIEDVESIFDELITDLTDDKDISDKSRSEMIVEKIKDYVECNYRKDISLLDVSDIVGLNMNYVCTVFKKETGVNFKEYLINKKMEYAKILLKDYSYKIKTIAEMVGYADQKHFSKQFRKVVGVVPTEYRKILGNL